MSDKLESSKKELLLEIDKFNKPGEAVGKYAWTKLVTYLLFMRKGSYPSNPNMGIDIQSYDFEFMDTAIGNLQSEIKNQISTYYPDIPLNSVSVESTTISGHAILLISLVFLDNGELDSSVIATEANSMTISDFEVSL